jgi:hypothetical protein
MRRRLHILALLPALLAAAMWARSYWRFDFGVAHGWTVGSELGALYVFDGSGSDAYYVSGPPGSNGRLEIETGSSHRPWSPFWTWRYQGDRFVAVQWWAANTGLAWWVWRRRKDRARGSTCRTCHTNRSAIRRRLET